MRWKQAYSLYKRGKFWYYRTYDEEGIRTSGISTGQTNKTAARCFCDELLKQDKLGIEKKIWFKDYASTFFDDNSVFVKDRAKPLSERSLKAYKMYLKHYILPYNNHLALNQIDYKALKKHRTELLEKVSPTTVERAFSTYRTILEQAFREGKIKQNPFLKLEGLKSTNKIRDAFSLDEVIFLYQTIDEEFKPLILLIALTGLRISEANGLRLIDIKQKNDFLYIDLKEQQIYNKRDKLKTGEERQIPIIPEIKDFIIDSFSMPKFYRRFVPIARMCPDAEKRLLSIHSLRHFFITNAKSCDINNLKVEKIAGHRLKGMEGVYTNFNVEDLTPILSWQKATLEKILNAEKKEMPLSGVNS